MDIELLTREAFSPYGDVIEAHNDANHFSINHGYTERYHDLADIDVSKGDGKTGISIFKSTPLPLPMQLNFLERHPLSSQAFIPMGACPYLVVVAEKSEEASDGVLSAPVRAFIARSNQGVNYHAGTWHHFCLALYEDSDFLVVDRIPKEPKNPHKNCDEVPLKNPISFTEEQIIDAVKNIELNDK